MARNMPNSCLTAPLRSAPLPAGGAAAAPWKLIVAGLCTTLLFGCTSIPKTPARLYNLSTGDLIKVNLFYFQRGHGHAVATLPDGTRLEGRYAVVPTASRNPRDSAAAVDLHAPGDPARWAEHFGYSRSAAPRPLGYGVLTGKAGDTLNIVFYSIDTRRGYGTGIARDNRGTWYRIHIGHPSDD